MRNIYKRLKELSKSFPPLKDIGPDRLQAAVLARLSRQDLLLLRGLNEKPKRLPVPPLSESESQAVEAYYKALEFESSRPASI